MDRDQKMGEALMSAAQEDGAAEPMQADAAESGTMTKSDAERGRAPSVKASASEPKPQQDPCIRAENEDDDGYDPYSDRRPDPEPLFEPDPWR